MGVGKKKLEPNFVFILNPIKIQNPVPNGEIRNCSLLLWSAEKRMLLPAGVVKYSGDDPLIPHPFEKKAP